MTNKSYSNQKYLFNLHGFQPITLFWSNSISPKGGNISSMKENKFSIPFLCIPELLIMFHKKFYIDNFCRSFWSFWTAWIYKWNIYYNDKIIYYSFVIFKFVQIYFLRNSYNKTSSTSKYLLTF